MTRGVLKGASTDVINRCPICLSAHLRLYIRDRERRLDRCAACGMVFVNPQPTAEALQQLYGGSYFMGTDPTLGYTDYLAAHEHLRRIARERFKLVERVHPVPGLLLDVGTATGEFLEIASENGWQTLGVEISALASRIARERGLQVVEGTLQRTALDAGADVVTMWDLIEHVKNPVAEVQQVHRLLRQGGYLIVGTPNRGSFRSRLSGRRWWAYYVSREHLFYFDAGSLRVLFRRCSFDPVLVQSREIDFSIRMAARQALAGEWRRIFGPPPIAHIPRTGIVGRARERLGSALGGHLLVMVGRRR